LRLNFALENKAEEHQQLGHLGGLDPDKALRILAEPLALVFVDHTLKLIFKSKVLMINFPSALIFDADFRKPTEPSIFSS
jgi:hypothetical protein